MRTRAERNIRRVGGNRRKAAGGIVERVVMSPGTLIDDGLDLPLPPMARRAAGEVIDRVDRLAESDQWKIEFDMPYAGTSPEKMGFPAFTLGQEWSQGERYDILQRCHQVWERNPICKAMVAYTTMFVTGNGLQISYKATEVQEVVEAFLTESNIPRREKEVCQGLVVDGEIFVRYHLAGNGKSRVSFLAPWNVISIETDPDDFETLVTYTVRSPDGTEEKPVPADEIEHVAINRMAYELRGRPDILPSLPWLKAARDWLEDKFRAVRRQASILYDVTLKGATPAQVKSKVAQLKQPPSPGSVVVHNDAEVWNLLSAPGPAAGDIEIGRLLKNMAIVGVLMPDFMFSDGANSNLAVATAQAYPPLKRFEYYQDTLEEYWMTIFRRVMSWAVEKGIIDEMVAEVDADGDPVFDVEVDGKEQTAKIGEAGGIPASDKKKPRMVKAIDAVSASYPSLDSNDILKLTQALTAQVAQGWTSDETAMHELGRDPTIERKRIEAEKAEDQSDEKVSQADQLAAQMAQQPTVPGEQPVPAMSPVVQPGGQVAGMQGQQVKPTAQGNMIPPVIP